MNKQDMKRMSNTLRKLRGKTGMNQTEFSKLCGISTPQYRRYETGVSYPREETLAKIASVLGVEVEEITGEKSDLSSRSIMEKLIQDSNNLSSLSCDDGCKKMSEQEKNDAILSALAISLSRTIRRIKLLENRDATTKLIDRLNEQSERIDSIGKATSLAIENTRAMRLAALIECYDDLTPEGQQVLLSVADALTYSPKYGNSEEETQEEPEENTDNQKETPGE